MDTEQPAHDRRDAARQGARRRLTRSRRSRLVATMIVLATEAAGPVVHAWPAADPAVGSVACCEMGEVASARAEEGPDAVADYAGGLAARVRTDDGIAVRGDVFVLMATVGSSAPARLFDATPFTHDSGPAADVVDSNRLARTAAEDLLGHELEPLVFTSAPGGGPSGGLAYLIAYLNQASDGALTGDLRVAATGELREEGYVALVRAASEKLPAARLAGADVLFTSSMPSHAALGVHATRTVGQNFRSRHGAVTLQVERGLDEYEAWGADRPSGLDVVVVGHVADVAAYLCGTGSEPACAIRDHFADVITTDELTSFDLARLARTGSISTDIVFGSPEVGGLS